MTNGEGKIILHADDDEMLRLSVGSVLKYIFPEASIKSFSDGAALEERFLQEPQANLVVTDNSMPHLSGLEFIQRYSARVSVPMVLISGDHNIGSKAIEYGATAYLRKPFELKEFTSVVRQILYPNGE